jgi:Predicted permeases
MDKKNFNQGLFLSAVGSFWWGFFGVLYFKYISFAGHIEVVVHRSLWTAVTLLVTTIIFSKWKVFKEIIFNKKQLFILFLSGVLIF